MVPLNVGGITTPPLFSSKISSLTSLNNSIVYTVSSKPLDDVPVIASTALCNETYPFPFTLHIASPTLNALLSEQEANIMSRANKVAIKLTFFILHLPFQI